MQTVLQRLVEAAVLAPSGDNMQPWRFQLAPGEGTIRAEVNQARDDSPMNAGQRMARIALGAAVENMLRTARHNGLDAAAEIDGATGTCLVRVRGDSGRSIEIEKLLGERVSNRRIYEGRSTSEADLSALRQHVKGEVGTTPNWIVDRSRLADLARLIARADAALFGNVAMRQAFFANVRFDAPPEEVVSEGLSLAALELKGADLAAFRMVRKLPAWLFRLGRIERQFAVRSKQLVESAAGLCIIAAADDGAATDVRVGQTFERSWLALTELGCAIQPMMSLPVLEGTMRYGSPELVATLDRQGVPGLLSELGQLVPELGGSRAGAILRFGFSNAPSGRTGRLPLSAAIPV